MRYHVCRQPSPSNDHSSEHRSPPKESVHLAENRAEIGVRDAGTKEFLKLISCDLGFVNHQEERIDLSLHIREEVLPFN